MRQWPTHMLHPKVFSSACGGSHSKGSRSRVMIDGTGFGSLDTRSRPHGGTSASLPVCGTCGGALRRKVEVTALRVVRVHRGGLPAGGCLDQGEERGEHQECRERGGGQPPDHGTAKRRALLAS